MQIRPRRSGAQLNRHHTLEAAENDRAPARVDLPVLPPADIDRLAIKTPLQESFERRTADLLLAIDQPDEPERQGTGMLLAEHAPACKSADEFPFVVGNATPVPATVPL